MNIETLNKLRELAEKAGADAWDFDTAETPIRIAGGEVVGGDALPYGDVYTKAEYEQLDEDGEPVSEPLIICREIGEHFGRFIAHASPAIVLELIALASQSLVAHTDAEKAIPPVSALTDDQAWEVIKAEQGTQITDWRGRAAIVIENPVEAGEVARAILTAVTPANQNSLQIIATITEGTVRLNPHGDEATITGKHAYEVRIPGDAPAPAKALVRLAAQDNQQPQANRPLAVQTAHLDAIKYALDTMRDNGLDECEAYEEARNALNAMKEAGNGS